MALTRASKKPVILATLTLIGQGEEIKFNVTYHNRTQTEVNEVIENPDRDAADRVVDTLLFMVKEWESDYPLTPEGIKELEDDRPGTIMAIIQGFHQARQVVRAKN